jgi:uncharacterized protein YjbI with pentapeptide repeats
MTNTKKQTVKTALTSKDNTETLAIAKQGLSGAKQVHSMTAVRNVTVNDPHYNAKYAGMDFAGKKVKDFLNSSVHTHLDFTGCNFEGADFTYEEHGCIYGLTLQACKFKDCNFNNAVMAYTDLRWSDFTGANGLDSVVICDITTNGDIVGGSAAKTDGCLGL